MRTLLPLLGFCLLAAIPARAQIMPATPQQIQQQGDSAIQKSGDSLDRGMTQQQIGQIEQDRRRDELFNQKIPGQINPGQPTPANLPPPDPVLPQSGAPAR